MPEGPDHYLKRELYRLIQIDQQIFDFLQNGSLDGLWYWDVENPTEEWLSPRFKELFGYTDDEVPNTSDWWQENIHPDDLRVVLDNFERHKVDPNHPYDQVVRYRHKDGSTVWIRCRGIAIRNEKGEATRMLGAHTDLTNLKRAELKLAESQAVLERRVGERTEQLQIRNKELQRESAQRLRAEEALRISQAELMRVARVKALGEMASGIAHELSQPLTANLTAISACRRLLQRNMGKVPAKILELMDHAIAEAKLAGNIIHNLREFIDTGTTVRTEENIEEVVDETLALAPINFGKIGIVVKRESAACNTPVWINKIQIQQVILNLVRNAIKAMAKSREKKLTVSTLSKNGTTVEVGIADTGSGIDGKIADRIFDHFVTTKPDGMGMGLAICRTIIENHGSRIWTEPRSGSGAVFRFSLPISDTQNA